MCRVMMLSFSAVEIGPWGVTLSHRPADLVSYMCGGTGRMVSTDGNLQVEALDDGDLAKRIRGAGDAVAEAEEAELCRRYYRRVRLYGLRHLGSEDRAEDLAQDVLLIALAKLRSGGVREPDRIGSFILGVARMRSKSSRRVRERDEQLDTSSDRLPHLQEDFQDFDPLARDRVVRCLESLTEQQKAVVVLTYYGEQSTRAIASSLGLTANNVRVTRQRGVARLRDCLGLEPEGDAA